ncbi:xylose isomerase [Luteitalea sp. TBR-22]|uniref:sugar phosphate isomerase/epimerase family protein n=1 Tax=Luteitalea sp. TBR-22 TaxID=2802971 RepID=UPI001AFAD4AB|nr:sugar phosphate isomerase/epimerase [Luteitalea sp. TBR-22]BCS35987.1 xylose isomerase [Luteitalea sp. TBR-22]
MRLFHTLLAASAAAALVVAGSVAPEASLSAAGAALAQGGPYKNPIALQLYSFRESFKTNGVPATLAKVKGMGFTHVELAGTYGLTREQFKTELQKAGLTPISMHTDIKALADPAASAKLLDDAKFFGLKYVGNAWFPHEGTFDEADAKAAIAAFNAAGKNVAAAGMQFFYHPHGFEFAPGTANRTLFDMVLAQTDPKAVKFELDIFWAHHGSADPVALLKAHPDRFVLTHMKDMKPGTKKDFTGHAPDDTSVALGTGEVNVKGVVEAARNTSVQWHIIEEESHEPEKNVPAGLAYLKSLAAGPR